MAISLVAHVSAGSSGGGTVTSGAIDTSGATLLVLEVGYNQGTSFTVSDSKGNTWTPLTAREITGSFASQLYYASAPTVGSGHTFTITCTGAFPSLCVGAFSGVAASPFDVQNGASRPGTGATTLATGSVTPTQDNELIVSAATWATSTTIAVGSGLTITDQLDVAAFDHYGSALAYIIQTTAAAVNATWSNYSSSDGAAVTIATFKAASNLPTSVTLNATTGVAATATLTASASGTITNATAFSANGSLPSPAIALVTHTCAGSTTGNNVTTSAIDTTGATLIVLEVSYSQGVSFTVTDSKGNTWTPLTAQDISAGTYGNQLYYANNANVGTGHTFTITSTNGFPSVCVASFSNVATVSPFDQQNGAHRVSTGATSLATGSITPSQNNELIVSAAAWSASTTIAVDSSLAITDQIDLIAFSHYGSGLAYIVQNTLGAINPTWSNYQGTDGAAVTIASFKAAVTGVFSVNALITNAIVIAASATISGSESAGVADVTAISASEVLGATRSGTLTNATTFAATEAMALSPSATITNASTMFASVSAMSAAASSTLTNGTNIQAAGTLPGNVVGLAVINANAVIAATRTLTATAAVTITDSVGFTATETINPSRSVTLLAASGFVAGAILTGAGSFAASGILDSVTAGFSAHASHTGLTTIIVKMFGVNIGVPYLLVFLNDGSAYSYRVDNGTSSLIAPAGTFSDTGAGDVAVWEGATVLIIDPATGYWRWPGSGAASSIPSVETIPAPQIGLASGGLVEAGAHSWAITFFKGSEGALGNQSPAVILGVASAVQLSGIAIGPTGTTERRIYRTKANQPGTYYFVDSLLDNTTTTFLDNIPDASLGVVSPAPGAVDAGAHQYAVAFSDGVTLSELSGQSQTLNTATSGTVIVFNLATGPIGTTMRLVYRTSLALPSTFQLAATIADNTTTSFNDIVPDSALGAPFSGQQGSAVSLIDATKVGTTIAVFAGRAWIANNRTVQFTAPNNFSDFSILDAAGSFVMTDSNFIGPIQKLLAALDALWIYGEAAINQLTNVTVIADTTTTTFSNVNVSSSLGTIFPQSVVSFLRQIEFASKYGVIQQVGVSPQRISEKIDGTYGLLDLTQPVTAGLVVLNEILCYGLMVTYLDPDNLGAPRKIILCVTFDGKWFIGSQGDTLIRMASVEHNGTYRLFGADESLIRELFVQPHYPVHKIKTPFFDGGDVTAGKEMVRCMMVMNFPEVTPITSHITPQSVLGPKTPLAADKSNLLELRDASGNIINVIGPDGETMQITGQGFQLQQWYTSFQSKLIGFDVSFDSDPFHICGYAIDVITRESWGDSD